MRNKVIDLEEILKDLHLEYVVTNKTKLDESLPNVQFKLNGYEVRARTNRHTYGGGLVKLLGKALSEKTKKMNLIAVSASALSLQFQRKSGFVLVDTGLHQHEILKHSLKT